MGPSELNDSENQLELRLNPQGPDVEAAQVEVVSTPVGAEKESENKSLAILGGDDGLLSSCAQQLPGGLLQSTLQHPKLLKNQGKL